MKDRSRFDEYSEVELMDLHEELIPGQPFVAHRGEEPVKHAEVGTREDVRVAVGDEHVQLACRPVLYCLKPDGCWAFKEAIDALSQRQQLFLQRRFYGALVATTIRQFHVHQRPEVGVVLTAEMGGFLQREPPSHNILGEYHHSALRLFRVCAL